MKGIERLGQLALGGLEWLGGLARMLLRVLRVGPRRPFAIDDIAMMSLRERTMLTSEEKTTRCDVCGKPAGDDATSGLFMWVRDEDYRFEEPAICKACSSQVSAQAYLRFLGPEE